MRELNLQLKLGQYLLEELPEEDRELVLQSREFAKNAYAPYSGFSVGAALRMDDGSMIGGNNQENAAYPSGICAERVALFSAGANFPGEQIMALAISVISKSKETDRVYAPCGGCRQVISEYQNRQEKPLRILFEGPGEYITVAQSIEDIMPFTFRLNQI